jgi:predicted phosphodiesterase
MEESVGGDMIRRPRGGKLFSVGLIADTHCNEAEDSSASPYPANAQANPRARYAFAYLEREKPLFVMHGGDMINPVPELPTYGRSGKLFHEIAADLSVPLHLVAGNHDIGDKPVSWMPAGTIDVESIAAYEEMFGRHYYKVCYEGIRFIVINAPLINSGLPQEADQKAFLEEEFARDPDTRTFLFIHYPLYVSDPDEPSSYDNIDEPGRSWLIRLIERTKPEALFAAHVHNFWYDVIGDTETYVLPSTCFVRHDYSEMFRIDGGDQYGRNDSAKLGFAMLDIYAEGHVVRYQRSYAGLLSSGEELPASVEPVVQVHTKTSNVTNLAVDMRRGWAEEFTVAPSGAVDEFARKRARNDYPVMALWEMGLRTMRVPIQDLVDARIRRRMVLMTAVGHRFHAYCYGLPDAAAAKLLTRHADLVSTLEVVVNWENFAEFYPQLASLQSATGIEICLSRVNRKDASKVSGKQYNHLISHGFGLAELDEVTDLLQRHDAGRAIGRVMVSVPREACPLVAAAEAAARADAMGRDLTLYIKSTSASPAEAFVDDNANAERFLKTAFAAVMYPNVGMIIDAFTDADRGYFVRSGLVDSRYNPRLGGQLLRQFMDVIGSGEGWHVTEAASGIGLVSKSGVVVQLESSGAGRPILKLC